LPQISPVLTGAVSAVVLLMPMLVIPHIYLMRKLSHLIKDLPSSNEAFSTREKLGATAKAMPTWLVYSGLVVGVGLMLLAAFNIYDVIATGRPADRLTPPIMSMISGLILAVQFGCFATIKKVSKAP
jgi:hypothetical protein